MWKSISGRQIDNLGMLCSGIVTGCSGRHAGQLWRWLCSRLSVSVGWRCTYAYASPAWLWMLCSAILAWKASKHVVLMKHCWVSLAHSLHLFMPTKRNPTLHLILDLVARIPNQIFCSLDCGVRKPFFGHFGYIEGQAHVGLFQLYPTSLPSDSSRHVENLHAISCCFQQCDSAITTTLYTSIASSKVIEACCVHSWGCLWGNSSGHIPELTTSWCSISQTVWTNAFHDHAGFPLRAVINWPCSSLWTSVVHHTINWWLFASMWIHSLSTAYCFLLLLLPFVRMFFKYASWVICLLAALAALV